MSIESVVTTGRCVSRLSLRAEADYAPTGLEFTLDAETIAAIVAARAALALLAEHHHRTADAAGDEVVDPATGVLAASRTIISLDAFTVFVGTPRHGDRESADTSDELVARFAPTLSTCVEAGESSTQRMTVRVRCANGPTVVELAGEIDLATAPYLQILLGLPPGDVVVDLTGVTFMACAGLTQLLRLRTHLHLNGAALRLTGASPGIRRMITLTGLQTLLPC